MKILLIEDHDGTRTILGRLLRAEGHELTAVANCHDAENEVSKGFFDLAISDLGLPDGNGRALLAVLRNIQPALVAIAVSAYGTPTDIAESLDCGFKSHLVKPVSFQKIKTAIQQVCAA